MGANSKLFFPPTNSENCWRFPGLRQSGRVAPSHWPIRGIGVYNQSQLRKGLFLSQKPGSGEFFVVDIFARITFSKSDNRQKLVEFSFDKPIPVFMRVPYTGIFHLIYVIFQ